MIAIFGKKIESLLAGKLYSNKFEGSPIRYTTALVFLSRESECL